MDILDALRNLDPLNDDHWTSNGDPRIDAVESFLGTKPTRAEIVAAAPDFNREKAAHPEDLLMNKPVEASPSPAASQNESDASAAVGQSAIDFLIENSDSETAALFSKFRSREPLTVKEMNKLLDGLDGDDARTFLVAFEDHLNLIEKSKQEFAVFEKAQRNLYGMVKNYVARVAPQESNEAGIRRYLDSQFAARMKAAQNRQAILRSLNPHEITPMSPLDQAMARKDNRGKQRPVWPGLR